jgi:hypothetical protein
MNGVFLVLCNFIILIMSPSQQLSQVKNSKNIAIVMYEIKIKVTGLVVTATVILTLYSLIDLYW